MARDFAKTGSSDYMSWATTGRLSEFLNGAAKISAGIWVFADTLGNTSTSDNVILRQFIETGAAASAAGIVINASNGTTNLVSVITQSQSGDSPQTSYSNATISTGAWTHIGVVCDYAADEVEIYINGSLDATRTVTWGATTYTDANNQSNTDGFSSNGSNLNHHWDGRMAEFGLWIDDIGADGFAMLAKGLSPLLVRPEVLVSHVPMVRDTIDVITGDTLSVTGSVPVAEHLQMVYPRRRRGPGIDSDSQPSSPSRRRRTMVM